ncbi:DNA/RNA polymerase superfamily protein [Gossypium australe]|uniref:DNA/RNA polymerase superfamily protein n=1 Tax=Gossypium australe TaxID=47621 RepID=A0A5B6WSR0_9ROSI|nr:DNA/RNA polymerase superfamily protein [Gossypium australe]
MALFEALYGWKCRTPLYWSELSENKLVEIDLIRETKYKVCVIRNSLKITSDMFRFGRKGKLSSRFIGPYEIVERIGPIAYKLALPLELENIHNIFHILMLRRYSLDTSHVISSSEIELQPCLSYSEKPIAILA